MRAEISPRQAAEWSRDAQERVLSTGFFRSAEVVALYAPVRNEVSTLEIMRRALELGKRVLFPVVSGETLVFREVRATADLSRGTFGIPEPSAACPEVRCADADLVVVPGVAFDRSGRRIGYGKGFYDRALHRLERTGRLVGLCYEFQLVQDIPASPHDVEVDVVVTENEVITAL